MIPFTCSIFFLRTPSLISLFVRQTGTLTKCSLQRDQTSSGQHQQQRLGTAASLHRLRGQLNYQKKNSNFSKITGNVASWIHSICATPYLIALLSDLWCRLTSLSCELHLAAKVVKIAQAITELHVNLSV